MAQTRSLDLAREAFDARRWRRAFELLQAADGEHPLGPDDLERYAVSAYLAGDDTGATGALTRVVRERAAQGDPERAAASG